MPAPATPLDAPTSSTASGEGLADKHLVLLEDDPDQTALVMRWLERDGFKTTHHASAADYLQTPPGAAHDLVLLDWNMPGLSGAGAYSALRDRLGPGVPILFITASTAHGELADMLKLGAQDVLVKPLGRDKLLGRIRAYLQPAGVAPECFAPNTCAPYALDDSSHSVRRDAELLVDDERDYALARELLEHPHRLVKRQELVGLLCELDDEADEHTLQTRLSGLTERLGWNRPGGWRLETVFSCGYRLEPPRTSR